LRGEAREMDDGRPLRSDDRCHWDENDQRSEIGGRMSEVRDRITNIIQTEKSFQTATAILEELYLVTRNAEDFHEIDVKLTNPFE
jgi:hypothetical protein